MAKLALPVATTKTKKVKPIPVKIVSEPCDSPKSTYDDSKWRAQDGLRTIQEAERIKADKPLMNNIKKLAQEQVASLKKFAK